MVSLPSKLKIKIMINGTNPIVGFAKSSYSRFEKLPVEKLCDGHPLEWIDFKIEKDDHTHETASVYSKVTSRGHMVVCGEPATAGQNEVMNDDSTLLQEVVVFNLPMQFSTLNWLLDNLEEEKSVLECRIKEKFVDATKAVLKSLIRKDFNERNEVENSLHSLGIRVTRNINKISPRSINIGKKDILELHKILTQPIKVTTVDAFINRLKECGIKTEPRKLQVHLGANANFFSLIKEKEKNKSKSLVF